MHLTETNIRVLEIDYNLTRIQILSQSTRILTPIVMHKAKKFLKGMRGENKGINGFYYKQLTNHNWAYLVASWLLHILVQTVIDAYSVRQLPFITVLGISNEIELCRFRPIRELVIGISHFICMKSTFADFREGNWHK